MQSDKGITCLSLFDGLSCGQVALNMAGVKYEKYFASEIDKHAIAVTQHNYPDTVQIGDVTKWREWDIDLGSINLLLAGFPCQSWSAAGKQKGDNDPRGALVHDLIAIWSEIKKYNPNVKFMFENVKMKREFLDYINDLFGVEAVELNSSLTSAQNRVRMYWANFDINEPEDMGISLHDIIEDTAMSLPGAIRGRRLNKATILGRRLDDRGKRQDYDKTVPITQCLEVRATNRDKSNCLTTVAKDTVLTTMDIGRHPDAFGRKLPFRYYTTTERCRLMGLPDNYCEPISQNQAVKATGNGWEVGMVASIFRALPPFT